MDALLQLQPERIVYISCNIETLARDLKYLTGAGNGIKSKDARGRDKTGRYRVVEITPYDMFPFTNHVETVVLLQRKDM